MKCQVCGNSARVFRNDFEFPPRYCSFKFNICCGCEHIKLLPPLSDSDSGQQYLRAHIFAVDAIPAKIRRRAQRVVDSLGKANSRIIYDIGAGNCSYAMAFTKLGYTGVAIDVERFNPNYPFFVKVDEFSNYLAEYGAAGFFSNHSFEHIELTELTSLLRLLKSKMTGGVVGYFVMPAAKLGLVRAGVYLEEFCYGHKNLFSKDSALIYFKEEFPESQGYLVSVSAFQFRAGFLLTRLQILTRLIFRGHLYRAVRLCDYLFANLWRGSPEELVVEVKKVEA